MPKTYLSDLMTEEEREKMKAHALKIEQKKSITEEWLAVCEFGKFYGWEAIQAFERGDITIPQMYSYIDGARKIYSAEVYDMAIAVAAGYRGNDKNNSFEKLLSQHITNMKEVS